MVLSRFFTLILRAAQAGFTPKNADLALKMGWV
jgi:hypothetical protein